MHLNNAVMGYYTLSFASIKLEESPSFIRAALPSHYPVPMMLFARFAVDKRMQGRGIGKSLLKDALLRTVGAAEIGGIAAILVDAVDDKMVKFYKDYRFEDCPVGERRLMISIKAVREILSISIEA